jgi:hypothetical protein
MLRFSIGCQHLDALGPQRPTTCLCDAAVRLLLPQTRFSVCLRCLAPPPSGPADEGASKNVFTVALFELI